MSFLDSVFGSSSDSDPTSSNPAVPGGIGKPLMIALLCAARKVYDFRISGFTVSRPNPSFCLATRGVSG